MNIEDVIDKINDELKDLLVKSKSQGHTNKYFSGKIEALEELLEWIEEDNA